MQFPYGEFVTIRRQTVDSYGDPVTTSEHKIGRCSFIVRRSNETIDDMREDVTSIATLLGPADSDIRNHDVVVRSNGEEWQVWGHPSVTTSPFSGWRPGFRTDLRRIEG